MKLPITFIIPLLLIISTLVTSFFMYQQNINSAERNIREVTLQDLKLDITRLQNILYNLLTEDKVAEAKLYLSVTAMNPSGVRVVRTPKF